MRIVTAREQAEMLLPWRTAFDEDAFWAEHAKTMQNFRDQAGGLKYVTPKPGITMAVGPNWSGSVPDVHPDYIPRETAKDDIHGYLNHDADGYVNFIHTAPNMRQMGIGRKLLDHAGITDTAHSVNMTSDGKKFMDSIRTAMPIYYHTTDNPDFKLDPNRVPYLAADPDDPTDAEWIDEIGGKPGIFVSPDKDLWPHDYGWPKSKKPQYDVEFDAPNLMATPGIHVPPWGSDPAEEYFVPADKYHHLKVKGITPRSSGGTDD